VRVLKSLAHENTSRFSVEYPSTTDAMAVGARNVPATVVSVTGEAITSTEGETGKEGGLEIN